jgi:hypothetical protein
MLIIHSFVLIIFNPVHEKSNLNSSHIIAAHYAKYVPKSH